MNNSSEIIRVLSELLYVIESDLMDAVQVLLFSKELLLKETLQFYSKVMVHTGEQI